MASNSFDARIKEVSRAFGEELFDYQREVMHSLYLRKDEVAPKALAFFPTGKGKSVTGLGAMLTYGAKEVLVIAPPITHKQWVELGEKMGLTVSVMSHATFRMKDTKVSKSVPIICDEFHLLGGRTGMGWKKFDRVARFLQAPIVIMSATPQYNDAERVYCIQHVLDPNSCKGGFETFIYTHCTLEPSFRGLPDVTGFKNFKSAIEYLKHLDHVFYIEDDAEYEIEDHRLRRTVLNEWDKYNFDSRTGLVMHSLMTRRVSAMQHALLNDEGLLSDEADEWIETIIRNVEGKVLIYCDHETIARAVWHSLSYTTASLLTGKTSKRMKDLLLANFKLEDGARVLVGTATLATGPDGMDKICDTMIILQDTQDDALRRQLVGRILPRGTSTDTSEKKFYRATYWLP